MLGNNKNIRIAIFCIIILITNSIVATADEEASAKRELLLFQDIPVVSAMKYEQSIDKAPASITIVTSEDIEMYGYRTLADILETVRGFYISYDRNYTYIGVRGFGRQRDFNSRILLLVNGHTLNEGIFGSALIETGFGIDLNSVERIEIIRGPGSSLYGTCAMFEVVNVVTKKGIESNGLKAFVSSGSYGKIQGNATLGNSFDNGLDLFVSGLLGDIKGQDLYYKEYDDPSTNNGIAEGADWDKYNGLLLTSTYRDFTLQGLTNSRNKGVPTGSWDTLFTSDESRTLDGHRFIELKYDHSISDDKNVMFRNYFDNYCFKGIYPYEDTIEFEHVNNRLFGSELQFRWDPLKNILLVIGSEYQNHLQASFRYWDESETFVDIDNPYNIISLYLQSEYQVINDLTFSIGIRRDRHSEAGSSTSPRMALIYNPTKSTALKFLYGEAFRAPSIYELNYEQTDSWVANPDLKPEKIKTMEIALKQQLSKELLGTISIYSNRMSDLIDMVNVSDNPDETISQYQNVSKVKARGIELELDARLKEYLRCNINYSFQYAKDNDTKEDLTNSPRHIISFGLSIPIMKYLTFAVNSHYETERITVYETKTDPYLLTNINISTKPFFDRLKLSFLIRNLFDVEYSNPGGYEHKQPAILQDGRNFTARMEYRF